MLAYYLYACLLLFLSYRGQCFFRNLFNWPWFCQLCRWWQSAARYVVYFLSVSPSLFPFVFCLSIEFDKTLMLEKTEGRRRRGWQRMRWLDGIANTWTGVGANSGRGWRAGKPGVLQFMGSQRVRYSWVTEQQMQILFDRITRSG